MITKDDVRRIAKLARLHLTETEVEKFARQLGAILEYAEILKEVDTGDVEPIAQITGLENIKRPDKVAPFEATDDLLACSPQPVEKRMIKVKNVF